ncbi:MAG: ABC transporter substrate-binding protein [Candidatus Krumholzibacteriota bacterium]
MSCNRLKGRAPVMNLACLRAAAFAVSLVALVLLASCGGTAGPGSSAGADQPAIDLWPTSSGEALTPSREGCGVLAEEASPGGNFVITLTEPVQPDRAPIPHNASERLVFAQLYETLIQVDCTGAAQPGLAEHWTCTEDSTVWVFTIREGARFWDGTRITAEDVRRAWFANEDCPAVSGRTSPWNWLNARARTVNALDARRLAVRLPEPHARFPMLLAHPATAVCVKRPGWAWPVGSGPARLRASDPAPLPDLACKPNQNHPAGPAWKNLTFRVLPDTDPRDHVATDMDLILVRDMAAVDFFEDAPGFHPVPLPWTRLYLLVCPPDMNPRGSGHWLKAAGKMDAGRDLTAVSARSWPEIVFPAGGDPECPQLSGPVTGAGSARLDWNLAAKNLDQDVIAYPGDDPGAREMAQRLGALAGQPARAAALPPGSIEFALQWQMAGAFILPFDQQYPTGCLQMATLLGTAAWLQEAALNQTVRTNDSLVSADRNVAPQKESPAEILTRQGLVHPLGVSRSWLVVRGSVAGLELAFDGTPLLAGLGVAAEASGSEAGP